MERVKVESSNIDTIGYEKDTSMMEVKFKNGTVYQYWGVSSSLWEDFQKAESKGKFFHSEIRSHVKEWKKL